jgi:hypothetical protein
MNAPATRTFCIPVVHAYVEHDGGTRPTRSARLSQITTFDEGDTTIPTVLGFSELACAEASDTALVETAYRIGSARSRSGRGAPRSGAGYPTGPLVADRKKAQGGVLRIGGRFPPPYPPPSEGGVERMLPFPFGKGRNLVSQPEQEIEDQYQ